MAQSDAPHYRTLLQRVEHGRQLRQLLCRVDLAADLVAERIVNERRGRFGHLVLVEGIVRQPVVMQIEETCARLGREPLQLGLDRSARTARACAEHDDRRDAAAGLQPLAQRRRRAEPLGRWRLRGRVR
eukprot:2725735-Prymnesium_polylepis.1